MKLYLLADLEGAAGVLNFQHYGDPGYIYHEEARELVTKEVNAAVAGFFAGGATEIVVVDWHGPSGIDIRLLDERVDYLRDFGPWPGLLDSSFDALAFVCFHAKAGTAFAHMAHSFDLDYLDMSINGISVGEFGAAVMCASELGVPTIFGAGDEAFTKEAQALAPGIETVAVKRGLQTDPGNDLPREKYVFHNVSALHSHPVRARQMIQAGAQRAVERFRQEKFGLVKLTPPLERIDLFRPSADRPQKTFSRACHPGSIIELLNLPLDEKPLRE